MIRFALLSIATLMLLPSSEAYCREQSKAKHKVLERSETIGPIAVPAIGLPSNKDGEAFDKEKYEKELLDRLAVVVKELEEQGIRGGQPVWLVVPMTDIERSAIVTPKVKAPGLSKLHIINISYTAEDYTAWKNHKYGRIEIKVSSDFGELSINFSDWSKEASNGIKSAVNSFYSQYPAKKWSTKATNAIRSGQVFVGMTKPQVMASIGRAYEINRTVGKWGVHEQWCYDGMYLYFENKVLKSWQD